MIDDLDAIPGIDPDRGDALRAMGYDTARELAVGYLTTDTRQIAAELDDRRAFHEYVRDHDLNLDLDPTTLSVEEQRDADVAGMMLLARERRVVADRLDADPTALDRLRVVEEGGRSLITGDLERIVAGDGVRPADIDWDVPCIVIGNRQLTYGPADPAPDWPREEHESAIGFPLAGDDLVEVESPSCTVTVERDHLELAGWLCGVDVFDDPSAVLLYDDDVPLRVHRDDTNHAVVVPFLT